MVTVEVLDKNNLHVPYAENEISFSIKGPGKIIGVGNGNPSSLEADKYLETIKVLPIENLKEKFIDDINVTGGTAAIYDDSQWQSAFKDDRSKAFGEKVKAVLYRGNFNLPEITGADMVTLFYKSLGREQSIYVNGKLIDANILKTDKGNAYVIDAATLHKGINSIAITATPLLKAQPWDNVNTDAGVFQIITPAAAYKRKLFSGLAQVIVQVEAEGEILLTATSGALKMGTLKLQAKQ